MSQKLRKHVKNWKKTSVGCDIDFTILLSMLKVKHTQEFVRGLRVCHSATCMLLVCADFSRYCFWCLLQKGISVLVMANFLIYFFSH